MHLLNHFDWPCYFYAEILGYNSFCLLISSTLMMPIFILGLVALIQLPAKVTIKTPGFSGKKYDYNQVKCGKLVGGYTSLFHLNVIK